MLAEFEGTQVWQTVKLFEKKKNLRKWNTSSEGAQLLTQSSRTPTARFDLRLVVEKFFLVFF